MLYWIIGWLCGAVASWTGVVIYWKVKLGLSWKDYIERWTVGPMEWLKAALYVIIWPIELVTVVYSAVYVKMLQRRMIRKFSILNKAS